MSTVIENFFIIKSIDPQVIEKTNQTIKAIAEKVAHDNIYKQIIVDFIEWEHENNIRKVFNNKYQSYKNIPLFAIINDEYKDREKSFDDFYYDLFRIAEKHSSNCELNKSTTIYFKSQGDKTFYRIWNTSCYKELMKEILENTELQSYEYWNNSDIPNDISKKDWKKREKEYDILFKDSNDFEDVMYAQHCKVAKYLSFRDTKKYEDVLNKYNLGDNDIIQKLKDKDITY
jgi:hypothetical protein